ncbi:hypothetical protein ACJX0J_025373, partial [Zea mays]
RAKSYPEQEAAMEVDLRPHHSNQYALTRSQPSTIGFLDNNWTRVAFMIQLCEEYLKNRIDFESLKLLGLHTIIYATAIPVEIYILIKFEYIFRFHNWDRLSIML